MPMKQEIVEKGGLQVCNLLSEFCVERMQAEKYFVVQTIQYKLLLSGMK